MIFIFDLDHTLLDTNALLAAWVKNVLKPIGITSKAFESALELERKLRRRSEKNVTLDSLCNTIERASGKTLSPLIRNSLILHYQHFSHAYLFKDVLPFLSRYPKKDLILVTSGNKQLQKAKLADKSVSSLFAKTFITSGKKANIIKKIAQKSGGKIVFIDDVPYEHEALGKSENIYHVLISRTKKDSRLAHRGQYVVKSLQEINKLDFIKRTSRSWKNKRRS